MSRQTFRDFHWIVVDDGLIPTKMNMDQEYYRLEPESGDGTTYPRNLELALKGVKTDLILFIEDDDWYDRAYVNIMRDHLGLFDLVGDIPSIYYHVSIPAWMLMNNKNHASLCQTGMNRKLIPLLEKILERRSAGIDINLWRSWKGKKILMRPTECWPLCVGMKGLPGRSGIGIGHKNHKNYKRDEGHVKLRELIGSDITYYKPFCL
jgi:hypothetical protein